MKVAICDDEIIELNNTKKQLEEAYKSLDLLVHTFNDGNKLLEAIDKTTYDLVILDIEMPEIDGLAVAKRLRKLGAKTAIVFLTSHVEYALKGYEVNALRYLTKPVKVEQLSEIITYLIDQSSEVKKLMLRDEEDMVFVSVKDIIYLEAQNQDIRLVTSDKEFFRRYNIKDYETELSEYFFVRCHRSYIVNLAYISRISKKEIYLDNGEILPLSRTKEKEVKEALVTYVKRSAI